MIIPSFLLSITLPYFFIILYWLIDKIIDKIKEDNK